MLKNTQPLRISAFFILVTILSVWSKQTILELSPTNPRSYGPIYLPEPLPSISTSIFEKTIQLEEIVWFRLKFNVNSTYFHPLVTLRIASLSDPDSFQVFNSTNILKDSYGWSAFFNGNAFNLSLHFDPDSDVLKRSRFSHDIYEIKQFIDIEEIQTDQSALGGFQTMAKNLFSTVSFCYPEDTRAPSNDSRVARMLPYGCTSFFVQSPFASPNGCMLSAGHCAISPSMGTTVQFNVPLSHESGLWRHPPVKDQFMVNFESLQIAPEGGEEDWAYFGLHENTNTGKPAWEVQKTLGYQVDLSEEWRKDAQVEVIGYGIVTEKYEKDSTQQKAKGAWTGFTVKKGVEYLRHRVDTTPGNSGSPVICPSSGKVVAIHVEGGCERKGDSSSNLATLFKTKGLSSALTFPKGVCQRHIRL